MKKILFILFFLFLLNFNSLHSKNSDEFYKKIGDTLKHNYQGCTVWLISSDIENLKMIGLRPSKKIKVYNGKLECRFVRFDIYEGSKKQSKQN